MRGVGELLTLLEGLVSSDGVKPRGRRDRLEDLKAISSLLRLEAVVEEAPWQEVAVLAVDAIETECRDAERKSNVTPRKEFGALLRLVVKTAPNGALGRTSLILLRLAEATIASNAREPYLGEDMWQIARIILESASYRDRLTDSLARVWIKRCESVLLEARDHSPLAMQNASRVLQLLVTPGTKKELPAETKRVEFVVSCLRKILGAGDASVEVVMIVITVIVRLANGNLINFLTENLMVVLKSAADQCTSIWNERRFRSEILTFFQHVIRLRAVDEEILNVLKFLITQEVQPISARPHKVLELEPEFFDTASLVFSTEEMLSRAELIQETNPAICAFWCRALCLALRRIYNPKGQLQLQGAVLLLNKSILDSGRSAPLSLILHALDSILIEQRMKISSPISMQLSISLLQLLSTSGQSAELTRKLLLAVRQIVISSSFESHALVEIVENLIKTKPFVLHPASPLAVNVLLAILTNSGSAPVSPTETLLGWLISSLEVDDCDPSNVAGVAALLLRYPCNWQPRHSIQGDPVFQQLDAFNSMYGRGVEWSKDSMSHLAKFSCELRVQMEGEITNDPVQGSSDPLSLMSEKGLQGGLNCLLTELKARLEGLNSEVGTDRSAEIDHLIHQEDILQLLERVCTVLPAAVKVFGTDSSEIVEELEVFNNALQERTMACFTAVIQGSSRDSMQSRGNNMKRGRKRTRKEIATFDSDSEEEDMNEARSKFPRDTMSMYQSQAPSLLAPQLNPKVFVGTNGRGGDDAATVEHMIKILECLSPLDKRIREFLRQLAHKLSGSTLASMDVASEAAKYRLRCIVWRSLAKIPGETAAVIREWLRSFGTSSDAMVAKLAQSYDSARHGLSVLTSILQECNSNVNSVSTKEDLLSHRGDIANVLLNYFELRKKRQFSENESVAFLDALNEFSRFNELPLKLQTACCSLLSDPNFIVRLSSALLCADLMGIRGLGYLQKMEKDKLMIPEIPFLWTSLIAAGEIASANVEHRIEALTWIYGRKDAWTRQTACVIEAVLDKVSIACGYFGRKELFTVHSSAIIHRYVRAEAQISNFPVQAAGYPTNQSMVFFSDFSSEIVVQLLVTDESGGTRRLSDHAAALNLDVSDLLKKDGCAIWRLWPRFFLDNDQHVHDQWTMLQNHVPNLEKLSSAMIEKVVAEMLLSITPKGSRSEPPMYDEPIILKTLWKFAGDANSDKEFRSLISDKPERMVNIVLQIWNVMEGTSTPGSGRSLWTISRALKILSEHGGLDAQVGAVKIACHTLIKLYQRARTEGNTEVAECATGVLDQYWKTNSQLQILALGGHLSYLTDFPRGSDILANLVGQEVRKKSLPDRVHSLRMAEKALSRVGRGLRPYIVHFILDEPALARIPSLDEKTAKELLGQLVRSCQDSNINSSNTQTTGVFEALSRFRIDSVSLDPIEDEILPHKGLPESSLVEEEKARAIEHLNAILTGDFVQSAIASSATLRAAFTIPASVRLLDFVGNEETKLELQSFLANSSSSKKRSISNLEESRPNVMQLDDEKLWCLCTTDDQAWMRELSATICDGYASHDDLFQYASVVAKVDSSFANRFLPCLVHIAGQSDGTFSPRFISLLDQHVFKQRENLVLRRVVYSCFQMLEFDRKCFFTLKRPVESSAQSGNMLISTIDSLRTAESAIRHRLYFEALYYVEEYIRRRESKQENVAKRRRSSELDRSGSSPNDLRASQLMLEALSKLNEPDALYGVSQDHDKSETRAQLYEREARFHQSLRIYDTMLQEKCDKTAELGVIRSLKGIGLMNIVERMCSTSQLEARIELDELRSEAAWRLGNWEFRPDRTERLDFHASVHETLIAIKRARIDKAAEHISHAKSITMRELLTSVEVQSVSDLRATSLRLAMLNTLHSAAKDSESLFEKLSEKQGLAEEEPQLALNFTLADIFNRNDLKPKLSVLLSTAARRSQTLDRIELAQSALDRGKNLEDANLLVRAEWNLCHSELLWESGEHRLAARTACSVVSVLGSDPANVEWSLVEGIEQTELAFLRSRACHDAAHWISEMRIENSESLTGEYLELASKAFHGTEDSAGMCKSLYRLAEFADKKHGRMLQRKASVEFRRSEQLLRMKEKELSRCEGALSRARSEKEKDDLMRHMVHLRKQIMLEETKITSFADESLQWVNMAIKNYFAALVAGSHSDIKGAFRGISLWLSQVGENSFASTNEVLRKEIIEKSFPWRKLLPLSYQLISRLSRRSGGEFQETLRTIVETMASGHPHHCLWHIWALSNGKRVPSKQRGASKFSADEDKVEAGQHLLNRLRRRHGALISQMEELGEGYIKLAETTISSNSSSSSYKLDRTKLGQIGELRLVAVPTLSLPIHGFETDEIVPHVVGFRSTLETVGGINVPKLVHCIGSDGVTRKQLVKGADDLRQDAVMEQLFCIVNELLRADSASRERKLRMRDYRVVPLTPCAGILQWVESTVPLSAYLVGRTGKEPDSSHRRFRPHDWTSYDCRKKLRDASDSKKEAVFDSICGHFGPVMRYFFLERFFKSSEWFSKRLNYIRSLAVSSVVGYIVGLGDRHGANILIDLRTAEVVHIDLGISFEQGKLLRTPELVPFRLTRDIVDGMGVNGVEGTFRRCCEVGLKLLRENKELLLTVIEVFLHDPLFKWVLSPLKAYHQQDDEGDSLFEEPELGIMDGVPGAMNELNSEAANALLRINEKLQGYDGNEVLSVESHVHRLITDATDRRLLCRMFEGWAPWV